MVILGREISMQILRGIMPLLGHFIKATPYFDAIKHRFELQEENMDDLVHNINRFIV